MHNFYSLRPPKPPPPHPGTNSDSRTDSAGEEDLARKYRKLEELRKSPLPPILWYVGLLLSVYFAAQLLRGAI